jgi:hypothetical protein
MNRTTIQNPCMMLTTLWNNTPIQAKCQERRSRMQCHQFMSLLLLFIVPINIQSLQLLNLNNGDTIMSSRMFNTMSNNATNQYFTGSLISRKDKRCRLKNILSVINASEREIMLMSLATTKQNILPPVPKQINAKLKRSSIFKRAITCRGGGSYDEKYYDNPTFGSEKQQLRQYIFTRDDVREQQQIHNYSRQQQQNRYNSNSYDSDIIYSQYHEVDDGTIDDEVDYDEEEIDEEDDDFEYYDSPMESKSSSSRIFHPPVVKLNDMVSALLNTCTMNERLQKLVKEIKQLAQCEQSTARAITYQQSINQEMLPTPFWYQLKQQESVMPTVNNNQVFEETSSTQFRMPISSTSSTPQGSLRGGSTTTVVRPLLFAQKHCDDGESYQKQIQQPSPTFMNNAFYHYHDHHWVHPNNNHNYHYKVAVTATNLPAAKGMNCKDSNEMVTLTDKRIWNTKTFSTTSDNKEHFKEFLQNMIRDVFDIIVPDDVKTRTSIDMIRRQQQQQSSLELTLAMIYLDRACSVGTPRKGNKQKQLLLHGQLTICPPCTSSTLHGLILASLLLSVSSVRGVSVEEIVRNKYLQLSSLLKSNSIHIEQITSYQKSFNRSDDDVLSLQQSLMEIVQIMKDSLGESGIFVSMEEMKQFRQSWELCFGSSQ